MLYNWLINRLFLMGIFSINIYTKFLINVSFFIDIFSLYWHYYSIYFYWFGQ